MRPCEVCGKPGQRHHIVFRSHGGLNIEVNYCYLCAWHHIDGPDAPHKNRAADLALKLREQRDLQNMFWCKTYRIAEIAEIIGMSRRTLARKMRNVPAVLGEYRREDIIKFIMGGRLYEELQDGHQRSAAASEDGFILLDSVGDQYGDDEGRSAGEG